MNSSGNPVIQQQDKKQDKEANHPHFSKNLANLPSVLINEILSFNNRKDFQSLASTNKFFKSVATNKTYNQLTAPPIDFAKFSDHYPKDNNKISLQHTWGGDSISAMIQLSNGQILSGTYADGCKRAQICLWQIPTGKLLAEIKTTLDQIDQLVEVSPNIIAVAHHSGHIEFYDFNAKKPNKLAQLTLPEGSNEHICAFSLCSPGKLAFVSFVWGGWGDDKPSTFQLRALHFDPKLINNSTIKIENIATVGSLAHHEQTLCSLDKERVVVTTIYGMSVYDTETSTQIKNIQFTSGNSYPYVFKLKNNKIVTGFVAHEEPRKLNLEIWDLSKEAGSEHCKTIVLPVKPRTRGIDTIFQRANGELVVIADDNWCGTRLLTVDVERENGKELLQEFNIMISSTYHSKFVEEGRYLITKNGRYIDCVRFPLAKSELEVKVNNSPKLK